MVLLQSEFLVESFCEARRMNELVSIIMPSYNSDRYIGQSIKSVINQTYVNWELIIVDDCSTDNTEKIVSEIKDTRIIFLKNEKNSGAAIARNKAISVAKGRWIAFLDSDDLWLPEKLEKQINFMNKNGYIFSYTDYERIDEDDISLNIYCSGPEIVDKNKMYRYCYPGCLTVMYNREKIGLIQINNIEKNNDYAMWLQVCKKADCYLLKEALSKYRVRRKSVSHDRLLKLIKSHYDLFRICDEKPPIIAFVFACRNIIFGFIKKKKYERVLK